MTDPNAWQTPQLREAMARLEEAEVGLDQTIANAKEMSRQLPASGLSPEDVQQIEEHARSKDAPRELRELQERIDRGDLSWNDIAAGRFLDDPQVRGALEGGVEGMRQAYTMIQEGHDLDEIIDPSGPSFSEGPSTSTPSAPPSPPPRPRPSRGGDDPDDDDYFGGSIMRRD